MTMDEVFNIIREKQIQARDAVCKELKNRDKSLKVRSPQVGKKYKNYVWLQVEESINREDFQGKLIYWITFFSINLDIKSGNPHVFFGEIQFWKDIQKHSYQKANGKIVYRYGPNEKINISFEKNENYSKYEDIKWYFHSEKSKDTKWNVDCIDSKDDKKYKNTKCLVDEFIKFMKKK